MLPVALLPNLSVSAIRELEHTEHIFLTMMLREHAIELHSWQRSLEPFLSCTLSVFFYITLFFLLFSHLSVSFTGVIALSLLCSQIRS